MMVDQLLQALKSDYQLCPHCKAPMSESIRLYRSGYLFMFNYACGSFTMMDLAGGKHNICTCTPDNPCSNLGELKYRKLNATQKSLIANGCGAKGSWVRPPSFMFEASCDHHDFNYWIGGNDQDRLRADKGFYEAMCRDIKRARTLLKPYYHLWARAYYQAVRMFGKSYFHTGDKRTWADLYVAVGRPEVPCVTPAVRKAA